MIFEIPEWVFDTVGALAVLVLVFLGLIGLIVVATWWGEETK